MEPVANNESTHDGSPLFPPTHWTTILRAGRGDGTVDSTGALESLCRTYWYPLYAFLRRRGYSPEDAADLVQDYLAKLLSRESLGGVSPEKGRFRSFLLAGLQNLLTDEWRRIRAEKRGGGQKLISLDGQDPEAMYVREPVDHRTPELLYEQKCANALLSRAMAGLEREWVGRNEATAPDRRREFAELQPLLTSTDRGGQYREVGLRIGMSAGAVGTAVYRLRQRYRELLRAEVIPTVADETEVDDEIRHLVRIASQAGDE